MCSINFTEHNKKLCLSLHYNGENSYMFVNAKEIHKFKAKDSEIVATPLCLGNISKDWSVGNIKKTELNGHAYDCSVDYNAIPTIGIPHIRKYLMIENDMYNKMLIKNWWNKTHIMAWNMYV